MPDNCRALIKDGIMKIAYFDCFAGAGGDMIAAVMLDAGLDIRFLKDQLATLGIDGLEVKITETKRGGLRALAFDPVAPEQHHHRNLQQITEIISKSKINEQAKKTAITIFEKLAEAEAAVHGKDVNDIHFHEVGAVDSIVDIVSAAIGLEYFRENGVEKIYSSALSVGGGTVQCAHGLLPVPAPATAELIKGIPVIGGPIEKELLTPTAAAILTSIVDEFGVLPAMEIEKIGYGAGTIESEEFPNVLRLIIGQAIELDLETADSICLLEINVDDQTGEVIGNVTERILKSGALDVYTVPIFMKHNRPAVKLSVISKIEDIQKVEQVLFKEGITLGIRRRILERSKLAREFVAVNTKYGDIRIKVGLLAGEVVSSKPEFSDCAAAAEKHNVAVKVILEAALSAYKKK